MVRSWSLKSTEKIIDGHRARRVLLGLTMVQASLYGMLAWLSNQFVYGSHYQQRPILLVVGLLAGCFLIYCFSLSIACRIPSHTGLAVRIILAAAAFRGILLPSVPIQEIDIYRYIWDGAVASQGLSPYRFSPAEVQAAAITPKSSGASVDEELKRLIRLCHEDAAIAESLRRIHYPELTTVYPPVSQAVFALAYYLVPSGVALSSRVLAMKVVLVFFDFATIFLLWFLLRMTNRHVGWLIGYAWCPLVLKEFANSGHLDSIAVCFTTATLLCVTRLYRPSSERCLFWVVMAGVLWGLSVGAKLYPVVLLPLLVLVMFRQVGGKALLFTGIALACGLLCLAPWFIFRVRSGYPGPTAVDGPLGPLDRSLPTPASQPSLAGRVQRRSGLAAFVTQWEMNDFLFLIVIENLRPADSPRQSPRPWFVVTPNRWRKAVVQQASRWGLIEESKAPFLLARTATLALFLLVVILLLGNLWHNRGPESFLEAAFLTVAWFWLLSPTQNPWYWTWALPVVPFARSRAWLAVSGLVFIYYVRFWLGYHFPSPGVAGTAYDGRTFFDLVITWFEFGPWLIWLIATALLRHKTANASFSDHPG
ncbi:MAG: hypothetical protein KatS3mg110_0967 [Pirellulaceae bacterium]|nr:MAG: hypothetical protein KatS3mg110_0967 [Pirellulaceae bacterium]